MPPLQQPQHGIIHHILSLIPTPQPKIRKPDKIIEIILDYPLNDIAS